MKKTKFGKLILILIHTQLTLWGFTSCTNNVEVLSSPMFLGMTGHRTFMTLEGFKTYDIKEFSASPAENEMLILPGVKVEVQGVLRIASDACMVQVTYIETPTIFK